MSKVKMPEPVILRTVMPDDYRYGHVYGYTWKQMDAYAAAKVQEMLHQEAKPDNIKRAEYYGEGYADGWKAALEEAYKSAREVEAKLLQDHLQHVSGPAAANYVANRLRALLSPKGSPA